MDLIRLATRSGMLLSGFMFCTGSVLAETKATDNAQPGFGVVLAVIAILVAVLIARYKRQTYLDG